MLRHWCYNPKEIEGKNSGLFSWSVIEKSCLRHFYCKKRTWTSLPERMFSQYIHICCFHGIGRRLKTKCHTAKAFCCHFNSKKRREGQPCHFPFSNWNNNKKTVFSVLVTSRSNVLQNWWYSIKLLDPDLVVYHRKYLSEIHICPLFNSVPLWICIFRRCIIESIFLLHNAYFQTENLEMISSPCFIWFFKLLLI